MLESNTENWTDLFSKGSLPAKFELNEQFLIHEFDLPDDVATVIVEKLNQLRVRWGTFHSWRRKELKEAFEDSVKAIYLSGLIAGFDSYKRARKTRLLAQESALLVKKIEVLETELRIAETKAFVHSK